MWLIGVGWGLKFTHTTKIIQTWVSEHLHSISVQEHLDNITEIEEQSNANCTSSGFLIIYPEIQEKLFWRRISRHPMPEESWSRAICFLSLLLWTEINKCGVWRMYEMKKEHWFFCFDISSLWSGRQNSAPEIWVFCRWAGFGVKKWQFTDYSNWTLCHTVRPDYFVWDLLLWMGQFISCR